MWGAVTAAATAAGFLLASKRLKPMAMCASCMKLIPEALADVHAMLVHPEKQSMDFNG